MPRASSVKPKAAAKDTPKRKKSVVVPELKPTMKAVAEAVLDGKTLAIAAQEAGCTPETARNYVKKSSDVQEYLAAHRSELSSAAQIKRGDVITGLMEAIDLAKLSADPGSMIRGWSEIGKMLGLYAPEKKEINITSNQRAIASKFEAMSDEELLQIADGSVNVIDGEFEQVPSRATRQ